ncbi:hypothetical protein NZK27_02345 [Synechococcus sp. FGCU-3]|nr:hypothetical protein [Synechococcus sp. FGCU3]
MSQNSFNSTPLSNMHTPPSSPEELLALQQDDGKVLLHGINPSPQCRAAYLYARELDLSVYELICLAYCIVASAEGGLDGAIRSEVASTGNAADTQAIHCWSLVSGGLTGIRITLQAMIDTPLPPSLWKTY